MGKNLERIDSVFVDQYKGLLAIQQSIFDQLKHYSFDLSKDEVTNAVISRMDAFWYFNVNNNKNILDRKINTTAADFFTETVMLFMKAYFEQKGLKVVSEATLPNSRIRPDISILKDEKVIAVVELKVSDGYKRKNMHFHLVEREHKIKSLVPDCYFGVLAFWNFFDVNLEGVGRKYFGLLQYDNHQRTPWSIEMLIEQINKTVSIYFDEL